MFDIFSLVKCHSELQNPSILKSALRMEKEVREEGEGEA